MTASPADAKAAIFANNICSYQRVSQQEVCCCRKGVGRFWYCFKAVISML